MLIFCIKSCRPISIIQTTLTGRVLLSKSSNLRESDTDTSNDLPKLKTSQNLNDMKWVRVKCQHKFAGRRCVVLPVLVHNNECSSFSSASGFCCTLARPFDPPLRRKRMGGPWCKFMYYRRTNRQIQTKLAWKHWDHTQMLNFALDNDGLLGKWRYGIYPLIRHFHLITSSSITTSGNWTTFGRIHLRTRSPFFLESGSGYSSQIRTKLVWRHWEPILMRGPGKGRIGVHPLICHFCLYIFSETTSRKTEFD